MKTKTLIILDKKIIKPFLFFLSLFFKKVKNKKKSNNFIPEDNIKTIAVCKFKGMGSIIQTTPMLAAIKSKFPNVKIFFISTLQNKAILENITIIDRAILIDDSSFPSFFKSLFKSLKILRKNHIDVYFDLEIYSDFSALFSLLVFSKKRLGFYLRSSKFRSKLFTSIQLYKTNIPIFKTYLLLSKNIGCLTEGFNLYPFSNLIFPNGDDENYIVININASDLRIERRWPQENYISLISLIISKYPDIIIFLIGNKNERNYTEKVENIINNKNLINIAGETSFESLVNIINGAKLMISNDTGPMHIAFCTKTPAICLFGPCSPELSGIHENTIKIYKEINCSPCVHEFEVSPCNGENLCMQLIKPQEVFKEVEFLLN